MSFPLSLCLFLSWSAKNWPRNDESRTFLFLSLKRLLFRCCKPKSYIATLYSLLSLFIMLILTRNERRTKTSMQREKMTFSCELRLARDKLLLCFLFIIKLPNLFFSRALHLQTFSKLYTEHVLDSVNSVMSFADYHLYDVMVRVGF